MSACPVCKIVISRQSKDSSKITCATCGALYHTNCLNLNKAEREAKQHWKCPSCSGQRRDDLNSPETLQRSASDPSVRSTPTTTINKKPAQPDMDTLYQMMLSIKQDNIEQFKGIRTHLKETEASLGKSIGSAHDELTEITRVLKEQQEVISSLRSTTEFLKDENNTLRAHIAKLEEQVIEQADYSRRNCVEISGVPEIQDEDVVKTVQSVGEAIGFSVSEGMIDACHRLGGKKEGSRGIIVKFVRRIDKEKFMEKKRIKKNLSTRHMQMHMDQPVYINESLSRYKRRLLFEVRQARREHNFAFVWVRNGIIRVRMQVDGPVWEIKSKNDLEDMLKNLKK